MNRIAYPTPSPTVTMELNYFFDSSFPNGSFGQSSGFETMVAKSTTLTDSDEARWIERYLLFHLWYGELEVISRAYQATCSSSNTDLVRFLDRALHASRPTVELQSAARTISVATTRAVGSLFGTEVMSQIADLVEPSTQIGVLAAQRDWNIDDVRRLVLSGVIKQLTTVMVRTGTIGQRRQLALIRQTWLSAERLAETRPDPDRPALPSQCYSIDLDQAEHAHLDPRLFQT